MEEYVWISKQIDTRFFLKHCKSVLIRLAKQYNVNITTAGPADNSDKPYVQAIRDAARRKVAGIMLVGWQSPGLIKAVNDAADRGIPIVTAGADVPQSKCLAHVGTDWFRMGRAMADELANMIARRGKVLVFHMSKMQNSRTGLGGFLERMKDYPDIQVLKPEDDCGGNFETSRQAAAGHLERHQDLAGIACLNNRSGVGAALALEQADRGRTVKLVCVGAEPEHLRHIRSGTIDAAFYQKLDSITCVAFQMLYAYKHGSAATGWQPGLANILGNIDTGYTLVTRDNCDSFRPGPDIDNLFERMRLSQQVNLLSSMVENSSDGINLCVIDPETKERRLVMCNDRFVEMSGYSREELMAARHLNALMRADALVQQFPAQEKDGIYRRGMSSWKRPDGKENYHEYTVTPLTINGKLHLVGCDRDVTERVIAERKLREHQNRLEMIMKHGYDGINICRLDPETGGRTLVICNDKYVEMSGRTYEELMACDDLDQFVVTRTETPDFLKLMKAGRPCKGMDSWIRLDGKENYHEWTAVPLETEGELYIIGIDRDVTERVVAERALREHQGRLETIMQHSMDGISLTVRSPDSRYRRLLLCNERFVAMSGRTREELMACDNLDKLVKLIESGRHWQDPIEPGRPYRGLSSWIRPDGKENYYEWTAVGIETDGEMHMVGIDRDVTERILAERKLKESQDSERRLRQGLQALHEVNMALGRVDSTRQLCRQAVELGRSKLGFDRLGIWFLCKDDPEYLVGSFGTDEQGNLRDESDRRNKMAPDHPFRRLLAGQPVVDLGQDAPLRNDRLEQVGTGARVMSALCDGQKVIGYLSADNLLMKKPIRKEDVQVLELFASSVGHLYTRKQTEEQLKASERDERFFRRGLQALHEINMKLSKTESVRQLCRRAVELGRSKLGFDRIGIWFSTEQGPFSFKGSYGTDENGKLRDEWGLSLTIADEQLKQVMAKGGNVVVDENQPLMDHCGREVGRGTRAYAQLRDGEKFIGFVAMDNLLSARPMTDYEAELLRLFASSIAHLYTRKVAEKERRRIEGQFRQAQKMEAVGRLAGGVAHDFNNQLTIIRGYADLLIQDLAEDDPVRDQVEEIRRAAGQAESLTSQLLTFSRTRALQSRTINLRDALRDIAGPLNRIIGDRIELSIVPHDGLGSVDVDPTLLNQAIINLVVNACDAMPQGGQITIEAKNVDLDEAYVRRHVEANAGRHIMLAVSDTGIGMDGETALRVFEPFFTTKPVGEGTGLGLAMVYGFVKQSGGHITVASESGHGSIFRIYLPRAEAQPAQERSADTSAKDFRGSETILVVENDRPIRDLLSRFLRDRGYSVLTAADAYEALPLSEQHDGTIDLVITDVMMPGMTGMELADELHRQRPDVPVLYITGSPKRSHIKRHLDQTRERLLGKPFAPNELGQVMRSMLRQATSRKS